jgi:hypothetical protein
MSIIIIRRRLTAVNLLFFAAVLSCLSGCSRSDNLGVSQRDIQNTATTLQHDGIMSRGEYERILDLQNKARSGQSLSESEIDWLLVIAHRPGSAQQQGYRMLPVIQVFAVGQRLNVPLSRKENVFDLATQTVKYTGKPEMLPVFGCVVLGRTKDVKALPYLKTALSSPDSNVSIAARRAIHTLTKASQ